MLLARGSSTPAPAFFAFAYVLKNTLLIYAYA